MSDADSSADSEPPCSGSTTDDEMIVFDKTGFITSGESLYGCLKYHPLHFHSEVPRPKAPFNPRVFDWALCTMKVPRLVNKSYA